MNSGAEEAESRTIVGRGSQAVPETPYAPISVPRPWWRGGLEFGSASSCGTNHPENEDSLLVETGDHPLLAVADGVGGGALGALASATLVQHLPDLFRLDWRDVGQATAWLHDADAAVAKALAAHTEAIGAATFVATQAGSSRGDRWRIAWVGDCRAYKWRSGTRSLERLSDDHTYARLGESPPAHAGPDDPARMVGSGAVDRLGLAETRLAEREILVLCSDGVFKAVTEQQMAEILSSSGTLADKCRRLIASARASGGQDDATVVCVERHAWVGVRGWLWWLMPLSLVCAVGLLLM